MPAEDSPNRAYYGQAKILRAYAYYNLVNLYARPYDVAKDQPALPIYTSQLTAETKGLSSVDQVYSLIINDLKEAITALDQFERSNKTELNVDIAKGF